MMRSLFSGVSGLKNHQTRMDVIGNNISNVNTAGFKGSRVVFQDMLSQTIQSASSPQGNRGGTNPQQIGLGVGIGSIDTIYSDGNVQSTGKNTDLCISGNGFFIVSDGANKIYSRAGAFEFDEEGNYVIPGSGLKVQGWMADEMGNISSNGEPTGIQIPKGQTIPAKATDALTYTKNLSSDAALPTTKSADFGPDYVKLYATNDGLPAVGGPTMTVNEDGSVDEVLVVNGSPAATSRIVITKTTNVDGSVVTKTEILNDTREDVYKSFNDSIVALNGGTGAGGGSNAGLNTAVNNLVTTGIAGASTATNNALNVFKAAWGACYSKIDGVPEISPNKTETLANLQAAYNSANSSTSLMNTAISQLKKLQEQVKNDAGITNSAAVIPMIDTLLSDAEALQTSLNATIAAGKKAVAVFGNLESSGTTETLTSTRKSAQVVAYDSLGTAHTITGIFEKTGLNEWTFYPGMAKGDYKTQDPTLKRYTDTGWEITGGEYKITFDSAGAVSNVSGSPITFSPDGATPVSITPDFSKMTQYAGDSTATCTEKTGWAAGSLDSVSIDTTGTIIGAFSNGQNRSLAQVAMATFNNPPGLTKTGNSLYQESNNSGAAQVSTANTGGAGKITASSLEMSNVDLSEEFSNMIITQRGFQANSKIITTSDEMIEILTNLKR